MPTSLPARRLRPEAKAYILAVATASIATASIAIAAVAVAWVFA